MLMRLKHVRQFRAKGRDYVYFRPTGERLPAVDAPDFLGKYQIALRRWQKTKPEEKPGTLGGILAAYRGSPDFTQLAPRTRTDYQKVMDWLQPLDGMALVEIDGPFAFDLRDKAFEQHKRRFALYVIQVCRRVWSWSAKRGFVRGNPFRDVEEIARPKDAAKANRPWSAAELVMILARAPEHLRLPIALGAYAGIREGDMLVLPWSAYDGSQLTWRQGKTGAEVQIPVHADLRTFLEAAKRVSTQIVVSSAQRPWKTGNAFRGAFFGLLRDMERAGEVGPGLTYHGLRHTAATRLAEIGASDRAIARLLGHRSLTMARHYSETVTGQAELVKLVRRLERKPKQNGKRSVKLSSDRS